MASDIYINWYEPTGGFPKDEKTEYVTFSYKSFATVIKNEKHLFDIEIGDGVARRFVSVLLEEKKSEIDNERIIPFGRYWYNSITKNYERRFEGFIKGCPTDVV